MGFKLNKKTGLLITILLLVILVIPVSRTHALFGEIFSLGDITSGFVTTLLDHITSAILTLVSYFIQITAFLLHYSILLTMNIKQVVSEIPAIFITWKAIRDVSGMLIIFMLLFASFKMILGMEDGAKKIVVNAIIGGILINFSFFFVGLMIDASNIISINIYESITNSPVKCSPTNQACNEKMRAELESGKTSGLSGVIMNGFNVTKFVNPNMFKNNSRGTEMFIFMKILIIITLIIIGLSFLVASGAFVVRFLILMFCLMVSPIWFASYIFPGTEKLKDWFWGILKGQLLFMPVYLAVLYVGLSLISELGKNAGQTYDSALTAAASILTTFTIAVFAINAPLLVAATFSSSLGSWSKKFGAQNIFGKVGGWAKGGAKWTGRAAFRNTVGAGASTLRNAPFMKEFGAKNQTFGRLMDKGLKSVATAGLGDKKAGYEQTQKATVKARAEYANFAGYDRAKVKTKVDDYQTKINQKLNIINRAEELATKPGVSEKIAGQARESATRNRAQLAEMLGEKDVTDLNEKQLKELIEKKVGNKEKEETEKERTAYQKLNWRGKELKEGQLSKMQEEIIKAITKQKSTADKIMEAIKEQEKQESEGKSDKGGGEKKEDKK